MASFLRHVRTVSGLTLVSRVLGLVRDAALAHVLGAGQLMDAYSQAFQIPNLLRRLFGEGALSAAFIPVFTGYLESGDRRSAARFMSLMAVVLTTTLAALALVAVGVFLVARHFTAAWPKWHLIFGLAAVMFPFAVTICLVALLQAGLNCCRHFVAPALAPILLNVFIIGAAVAGGVLVPASPLVQVYLIAGTIVVAGVVQVLIQVPALVRHGLLARPVLDLGHPGLRRVLRLMGPMMLAVGVVQFNALMDATLANLFSPYTEGQTTFTLAGRPVAYPMETGAAAMLYYGQRLYNFPLGVFAIALATVIFPELSRRAHRRDAKGLGRVASQGLRLSLFIGVPAGVGLMLVCEPLLALWLGHGRFADRPDAVARAAWVTRAYAVGIWAYSANHILVRAFYAAEDMRTPLKVAAWAALANLGLNLVLLWVLAERGLALATALSATGQFVALAALVNRRLGHLAGREILASAGRTLLATAVMAGATAAVVFAGAGALGGTGRGAALVAVLLGTGAGAAVFALTARLLGMPELADLLARRPAEPKDGPPSDGSAPLALDSDPPAR